MAFESVRSYVQLASGLGEMTRARAMEAAQGLLSLPGADEVTRRAVQASTLADQLLEAARANRANLMALVQHEVEAALKRSDVARVADISAAQAALAGLAREIADLRSALRSGGAAAVAGASRGTLSRVVPRSGAVSTTVRAEAPSAQAPATRTAATTSTAKRPTAKKPTAKKATAESTATRATPARKATAKKATPARKSAAKKATAKKATAARKGAAKKATPARKGAATKSTTRKSTAAKRASATKSTTTKATAPRNTATTKESATS